MDMVFRFQSCFTFVCTSQPRPRMASYPFLFNGMTMKPNKNGCVLMVTGCAIRVPKGLIPCWLAVSNWNVGGHNIGCPNFFHISSGSTFTPDPPSTIVSVSTVPSIPISTTVGCLPVVSASSIRPIVVVLLPLFPISSVAFGSGVMFNIVARNWGIVRSFNFIGTSICITSLIIFFFARFLFEVPAVSSVCNFSSFICFSNSVRVCCNLFFPSSASR